uniref:5-demethoxyubiquinone hydroxylase, mitochondrial n=1 Tax=Strigamia maritima TaxID=126957 RepID=T1JA78_STRMM
MAARRATSRFRFELIDKILRVDHAGELGADRIYAGQMAVLGKTSVGPVIQHMWDQEKHHLKTFEQLISQYRARPTVMVPIWNIAGFLLGAGSAVLGRKASMACTVAVEDVISKHYDNQIRQLMTDADSTEQHTELLEILKQFRDDEIEHHDTALAHEARQMPLFSLFTNCIKAGCHAAIWISEKV